MGSVTLDIDETLSPRATRAAAIATGTPITDPMSGYFAISQQVVIEALPKLSNGGFKVLLDLTLSSPRTLNVVELPFSFRSRAAGASKLDSVVVAQFIAILIEKKIGSLTPTRLMMFLSVGGLGVVVHLTILKIAIAFVGVRFEIAQIAAVIVAVAFNFFLNNAFTYRDRRLKGWSIVRGLTSFYAICGLGAFANAALADLLYATGHAWWAAGVAGAAFGALWNYAAASFVTWQSR